MEAINAAHAFLDGNKRLSWLTCVEFLELNGLELVDIPAQEIDSMIRALVRHDLTFDDFRSWVEDKIDI